MEIHTDSTLNLHIETALRLELHRYYNGRNKYFCNLKQ